MHVRQHMACSGRRWELTVGELEHAEVVGRRVEEGVEADEAVVGLAAHVAPQADLLQRRVPPRQRLPGVETGKIYTHIRGLASKHQTSSSPDTRCNALTRHDLLRGRWTRDPRGQDPTHLGQRHDGFMLHGAACMHVHPHESRGLPDQPAELSDLGRTQVPPRQLGALEAGQLRLQDGRQLAPADGAGPVEAEY